jgi:hypothetical protein
MSGQTVPDNTLEALLDQLSALKTSFKPGDSLRVQKLLAQLGRRRFPDAASLIRLHELLLFLCAYPHTHAMRQMAEALLATFHERVTRLGISGTEVSVFANPRVSGIAGTAFSAIWGYDIARYLAAWSQPIDGGKPVQLTNFKTLGIDTYDLSADGRQIACSRWRSNSDVVLIKDFR